MKSGKEGSLMILSTHSLAADKVIVCNNMFQNYNRSRIHSYRGVKEIIIFLDNVVIFKGEIARACGSITGSIHQFGDVSNIFIFNFFV